MAAIYIGRGTERQLFEQETKAGRDSQAVLRSVPLGQFHVRTGNCLVSQRSDNAIGHLTP